MLHLFGSELRSKGYVVVQTFNHSGCGSGPCLIIGGLENARHIVPTTVLVRVFKNLQITSKLLTRGYKYNKLRKHFESHTPNFCRNWWYFVSRICVKGFSHPVVCSDLVFKLGMAKGTAHSISSGSKILTRLRRRQYDPLIIERDYRSFALPLYSLVHTFPKALDSD